MERNRKQIERKRAGCTCTNIVLSVNRFYRDNISAKTFDFWQSLEEKSDILNVTKSVFTCRYILIYSMVCQKYFCQSIILVIFLCHLGWLVAQLFPPLEKPFLNKHYELTYLFLSLWCYWTNYNLLKIFG